MIDNYCEQQWIAKQWVTLKDARAGGYWRTLGTVTASNGESAWRKAEAQWPGKVDVCRPLGCGD